MTSATHRAMSEYGREAADSGNGSLFSTRTTATIVGVLFLIATVTYAVASGLFDSLVNAPDFLRQISANSTQAEISVLLTFVAATANIGIGVLLFPILKRHSETIAVGYLATRIIDGAGIMISGILALSLVAFSHRAVETGTEGAAASMNLGDLLITGSDTTYLVTMMALGIGAMPFCYLLYRTRLIPRPLAALGFVGYAGLFIGSTLELVGVDLMMLHYIPGGLFEFLLPVLLIFRGFNPAAIAPETPAAPATQEKLRMSAA